VFLPDSVIVFALWQAAPGVPVPHDSMDFRIASRKEK
jgi:hypothetical protein